MKKKILQIFVFIFLLLGIVNFKVSALTETQIKNLNQTEKFELFTLNIENTHEYYLKANNLNEKGKDLYRTLVNHYTASIDNYNKPIEWSNKISTELSEEEITNVLIAFLYDYKVFFWLTGNLRYDISKIPVLDVVNYTFHFGILEIYQDPVVFKKDLEEIIINREKIKNLVDEQKNTYDKIKVIHDWLLENNNYNRSGEESHTPVGALVSRFDPVCEAYAEAFLMIANYVNIKAVYGTGMASNQSGTEAHAWNYVYVYDKYYFLDVTWDKPVNSPIINYTYFLTDIPDTHVRDATEVLPQPFTTSKYKKATLVEFDVISNYYYERTGTPIKGYESVKVVGNPLIEVTVEYYKADHTKLTGIPSDLGKYYFVVTPRKPTELNGDLVVYFEIVPRLFEVKFIDANTLEVVNICKVYEGQDAKLPKSNVEGYKYVPNSNDYLNVRSDVEVYVRLEKINITFINSNGEVIENINLFSNTANGILTYDFDFINNDPKKIFIGWLLNDELITSETILTEDAELHPLIEDIKFTIKNTILGLDGYYKIKKENYNIEEITLTSPNQVILEKTISEVDEKGNYIIKLKIGSNSSTQERIVEIPMRQSTMLPFDLEKNQLIFYGVVILIGIIAISVVSSAIKKKRQ